MAERGYLKLVKTFGDDLAWQIQGQLIDGYFHLKQQATMPVVNQPVSKPASAQTTQRQTQQ